MSPPDWLTTHGGELKLSSDGNTWYVVIGQQAQYALAPTPVSGKFGCCIRQTINGGRVDCPGTYPGRDEALRGGLEDLRKSLGW